MTLALGHRSVEECQRHVSSREFVEWVAFDAFEPIGSRTVPDLLALLIALTGNIWRDKGKRALIPEDIFPDPLAPPRLSPQEEAKRIGSIAGDYRRLRAERLAATMATKGTN